MCGNASSAAASAARFPIAPKSMPEVSSGAPS